MLLSSISKLFVCAALAVPALAQVSGVVTASGRPVPGATVVWTSGGASQSVSTDESGRFTLDPAPPTPVEVEIRLFGFQSKKITVDPASKAAPAAVALDLLPFRPVTAAAKTNGRGANGRFQNTELMRSLEGDIVLCTRDLRRPCGQGYRDRHLRTLITLRAADVNGLCQRHTAPQAERPRGR